MPATNVKRDTGTGNGFARTREERESSIVKIRINITNAILMGGFLLAAGSFAAAQSAGTVAAMIPALTDNGTAAKANAPVSWNDTLATDTKGRARVTLTDGSILSLGGKSQMQVVKHDAKSQQTELALKYGRVRSEVTALTQPGAKFEVRTPNAVAGVIGTTYTVEYENGKTRVMTESGNVSVLALNGGKSATVSQGDEAVVDDSGLITISRVAASVGSSASSGSTAALAAGLGATAAGTVVANVAPGQASSQSPPK